MRFFISFLMVCVILLLAQPGAAQNIDEVATARRIAEIQKEIRDLQKAIARLKEPKEPIKTGVSVSCTLRATPVRGRMIPRFGPYGEGATIRILSAEDKKIVAQGKTDETSSVALAVPPGKYLVEVLPRWSSWPSGPMIEVTVEKDQVTAVGVTISANVLK